MSFHVGDDSVGRSRESIPTTKADELKKEAPLVDTGLSSIKKSESVKPELIPLMNTPILSVPNNMDSAAFAVASVDASGKPTTNVIQSLILKGEEIKSDILEGWMKNLREIEEYVRQILVSPLYQQLQELRLKGNPEIGAVSGVEEKRTATQTGQTESVNLLSTLDRLQAMERVPPTAQVSDTSTPHDASQVLVIPLTAALLAGGLVVGTEVVNAATHPMGGFFDVIERLQPIFPQVSVQDLIPVINLMVVAPIYFNSWNEAISNIKERERHSYVQTAHNFAKDVIKIVTDENFVRKTLISRMRGTDQLSNEDQDRLTRMLKIVLIGVALSLLYSVEIGKVQDSKYGGIEPEELRDLILGRWHKRSEKKPSPHEELTLSLINRAREQLEALQEKDREQAAELLLEYVTQTRDLDPMLDPAKVFDETLSSSLFNPKEKIDMFKA